MLKLIATLVRLIANLKKPFQKAKLYRFILKIIIFNF